MRTGYLEFMVLAYLAIHDRDGNMRRRYGWKIADWINEGRKCEECVRQASIYRVLDSLEKKGLAFRTPGPAHETYARMPRSYFTLTKDGYRSFDELAAHMTTIRDQLSTAIDAARSVNKEQNHG